MHMFKEMIETIRRSGFYYRPDANNVAVKEYDLDDFFFMCEEAKVFVFDNKKEANQAIEENNSTSKKSRLVLNNDMPDDWLEKFSPPFAVCSFETLVGAFAIGSRSKDSPIDVWCTIIREISPGNFENWSLVSPANDYRNKGVFKYRNSTHKLELLAASYFLNRLSNDDSGVEKVNEKIKLGRGKSKREHVIKNIVIIGNKTMTKSITGREVDWSHRFWVRGHWRKNSGKLGKDRNGDYCVKDFTWVTEHTKGPEELPVIDKTRFVV